MLGQRFRRVGRESLPWLILAVVAGLAVWHVFDFSEARETEFPRVIRPFYNPLSPKAYRLAEPGDTLDRVALYLASFAAAVSLIAVGGWLVDRTKPLAFWPSALAISLFAVWCAATPGPTFDGWHGWGVGVVLSPLASFGTRAVVALLAAVLIGVVVINVAREWSDRASWWARARERRVRGLLSASIGFVLLSRLDPRILQPEGYWPRVWVDLGLLAFGFVLVRARPFDGFLSRTKTVASCLAVWVVLVAVGIGVAWYHRPLARLHAVVPGKIYISAMPSYLGLSVEQERLHFKTIINLFDEASTEASPYHEAEIQFVKEHNLRYLGSPSHGLESDRFLDETLQIAQNPEAWPILVHCHGCMDRSPAWMGIYRFVVEGRPLAEVFAEIERHRGSRPKAVVTLQYSRKLPSRAPQRCSTDPVARRLPELLAGTVDPFLKPNWNHTATGRRVITRIDPDPNRIRP